MDKIRIGIVGSKFAADFHCDAYSRLPGVELAAVAAIDNLKEISSKWHIPRTYEKYEEMFAREDVQLVSVCVPNFLHHRVVLAAAKAGKNVLCEKPLGISSAEAREMVDACRAARVKLFYAEDWVFAPALRRAAGIVKEGAVGDVLYVKAKEAHNGTHSPFAKNARTCGGGSLIHLGIHPIGWVLQFLGRDGGNPVTEVLAAANGGGADNFVHKDNTGEDWACGVLKFAGGQRAFVEGNYITVGGMEDRVEIYGSRGRLTVDLTFGSPVTVYSRDGYGYSIEKADNTLGWTRPAVDEFYNLGYVHELGYAVECVRKDAPPMYAASGELGLRCNQVVEAMYQSVREGKVVRGNW